MNQAKTGAFLKQLRREKDLTQEQLAERFFVSVRTVSRWETGSNMPDLSILIELADFYDVDIREMIDGERKSETMNDKTNDAVKKVAEYTAEEKKKLRNRMAEMMAASAVLLVFCSLLSATNGFDGWIIERAYRNIMNFTLGLTTAALILNIFFLFGVFETIRVKKQAYLNRKKKNTEKNIDRSMKD